MLEPRDPQLTLTQRTSRSTISFRIKWAGSVPLPWAVWASLLQFRAQLPSATTHRFVDPTLRAVKAARLRPQQTPRRPLPVPGNLLQGAEHLVHLSGHRPVDPDWRAHGRRVLPLLICSASKKGEAGPRGPASLLVRPIRLSARSPASRASGSHTATVPSLELQSGAVRVSHLVQVQEKARQSRRNPHIGSHQSCLTWKENFTPTSLHNIRIGRALRSLRHSALA